MPDDVVAKRFAFLRNKLPKLPNQTTPKGAFLNLPSRYCPFKLTCLGNIAATVENEVK